MKPLRLTVIASLIALAACSGNDVKTTLGLDRGTPDEFRVVSRPPLSVPPDFTLKPPVSPGDSVPGQPSMTSRAQTLLTSSAANNQPVPPGVTVGKAIASSAPDQPVKPAEAAFLNSAGADQADPKVRDEIMQDQVVASQRQADDTSWWNFWSYSNRKPDPLVNAGQEQQRIQTDQDSGQPVTTGDTPVVKQTDTGLVGKIFGY